jgi:hypothetical protein
MVLVVSATGLAGRERGADVRSRRSNGYAVQRRGRYTVKLSVGGQSYKRRLIVKPDPAVIHYLSPPPFSMGASNAFILS